MCIESNKKKGMNKGQFKIGNNASCKKWQSVEELESDIQAYFDGCDNNLIETDKGKVKEPYTIQGLAEALDVDRKTLLNYEKAKGYEPYFHTIKKAKNKIERQKVVNGLIGVSNPTITIFDLKNNHDHKDKQEINQKTEHDFKQPIWETTDFEKKK